ncbi:MAG: ABC transporter permease, partial [Thermaceae bacterium]|nr:ABC transporter permease [Thermaceae bacterium]
MALSAVGQKPGRTRRKLKPSLAVGLGIVGVFLLMALVPGLIAPYSPTTFDYQTILHGPSTKHFFGTDNFGRDVFSRVVWGAQLDMQIALFTTLFPFLFGTLIGSLTGYYGGSGAASAAEPRLGRWADALFGRIVDIVVTFPFLVLVIAIVAVLGPGLKNMYIAVSAVGWITYGRLVRAEIRGQKKTEYALA